MKWKVYPKYKDSGVEWLGEVPVHWQIKRLDFLASVKARLGWKGLTASEYVDDGYIFLSTPNIKGENGIDFENVNYITEDRYLESPEIMLKEDDVLIAKDGSTLGITNVVRSLPRPATVNSSIAVIRTKGSINSYYLIRWLCSTFMQATIESLKDGQGVPHLFQSDIRKFTVVSPGKSEQTAIADFLDRETGHLDTLITKKQALIDLLNEKRTALISQIATHGLPADAAREFGLEPLTRFKDSGIKWLKKIPKEWEILPFSKYVTEKSDYRGKTPEKYDSGIFLVTAKNVRMGYIDYDISREYVAESDYNSIMRRGLPKIGDILFTTEAPLGNVALVDREDVAMAQRIIRFRMEPNKFIPRFALYAMISDYFQNQLASLSTGSTAEGLKASKLNQLRLICPPIDQQIVLTSYLDQETGKIDSLIEKIQDAIAHLLEYRTALITAAVTGKIDVRDHISNKEAA